MTAGTGKRTGNPCVFRVKNVSECFATSSLLPLALILFLRAPAQAWHCDGHQAITRTAILAVRDSLPPFFGKGAALAVHCSCDPDIYRDKSLPQMRSVEHYEHYLDLELLSDTLYPDTRDAFIAHCQKNGVTPASVGYLPYTVIEWTQKLAIIFAEYRKWPRNSHIQTRALVYAGTGSHYAADLCNPLHVTIHYDGRVKPDGTKSGAGIHNRVDALAGKAGFPADTILKSLTIRAYADLWSAVKNQVTVSRGGIDRVYALETQLPDVPKPIGGDQAVRAFTLDMTRHAVRFVAGLYLTAWKLSETIVIPQWHTRPEKE